MAFWFQCPICKSKRLATDGIIGRRVRCADCSNFVDVGIPPKNSHVDDEEMLRIADEMITEESLANPLQSAATGLPPAEQLVGDVGALDESLPDDLLADVEPVEIIAGEVVADSDTFDLTSPSVEIIDLEETARNRPSATEVRLAEAAGSAAGVTPSAEPKQPKSKATQPELSPSDSDFAEPPVYKRKGTRDESEMDMTPMVDVTFLLLIFFMVTASFTMQKSMNRPTETTEDPSTETVENEEDNPDMVQVDIDEFNSYFVILPEEEPIEAPSEHDLRIALRNAKEGGATGISPTKLLIRAHAESFHDRVVTAMDVGTDLDYQLQVQIIDGDM